MKRVIALLMENQPGALSRVVGLFSQRGYNIETLVVAPTTDPTLSRLTMSTEGDEKVVEQITKQLNKLIDVVMVSDLSDSQHIEKELMLVKFTEDSFPKETFERIIISHCLEHIPFPEKFLFEMMSKLKPGGILSISLPTDPGLLFRLGRLYLKIFSIKKNYQITKEEFDYMNATEHINSIFALKSLINFHYKNKIKEFYLPFKIKLIDLNLFYNVHITK